ncbi:MAG: Ppx/GppA phosphatase family protein [Rhizobiaceae bacterium]
MECRLRPQGSRRAKRNKVKHPDSDATTSAEGASRGSSGAGIHPGGESARTDGAAGSAPRTDDAQRPHGRKRRKRKRGRKVFARPEGQAGAAQPSPAASPNPPNQPAPASRPLPPRFPGHDAAFAALDLGTNNCRLLVATPTRPGQFRVVDAFSRIVRLGEGLSATGRLSDAAMERAIGALKICADKLQARPIRRARLIATEACRAAANGEEFLASVEAETGIRLQIIDRETEARLAVSGCGSLVERDTQGVVLFDIGGGSSEIALIDLSQRRSPRLANHIVSWTSLPVGVVSLAERFGGRDVTRESFQAMVDEVVGHISRFRGSGRLDHLREGGRFHLLGTSGTVTTLAGVHLGLDRYDRRRVDGLWMDRTSVDEMIEKLLGWDFAARVANPCIGPDRADLVLAGCAILEGIRAVWPSERLRVADRGLREGILTELMAEEGVWRRRPEGQRQ